VNQTSPAQPTIALAESSKAMCSMFQEALAGADVEFVFLHEPRAVLEYLEEHTPNLLLISTKMPGQGRLLPAPGMPQKPPQPEHTP